MTTSGYVQRILERTELMSPQHRAWKPPLGDVCFRRMADPPLQSTPLCTMTFSLFSRPHKCAENNVLNMTTDGKDARDLTITKNNHQCFNLKILNSLITIELLKRYWRDGSDSKTLAV